MLPSDHAIRPFSWRDIPAITEIYRHYVENTVVTFDTTPPGETAMAEKFGHMVEQGHPVLALENASGLIGYAYASTYRPRPAYRFTCEDSIYLHPDHTGKGLGGVMLERLLEESRAHGFKQMLAVITATTQGSVRLHEKFGFRTLGTFPVLGYKFDQWLDVVHMQRAL